MEGRDRTAIFALLLCAIAGAPTAGQVLDVCASCHVDATCDDKVDNSGKVCNCKYGFVGNGRTFCQDKDECQIGASKICGLHSSCHNTYGSYYCTCKHGFSPSNNRVNFIPNDGTHCLDIDECRMEGLCREGGQCWNLEGSFECSCQLGYRVHDGAEPFHPHTDRAYCKVVECGPPQPPEDAVLLSVSGTTYGSMATFACDEGFLWRRGDNASLCGQDGLWKGAPMVCEDKDECQIGASKICGLHSSCHNTYGSYYCTCKHGFSPSNNRVNFIPNDGTHCLDIDECRMEGLCREGGQCWNLEGSFECSCQLGYRVHDGAEPFHPHTDRAYCKVVECGPPQPPEDAVLLSVSGTSYGGMATFACDEGFLWRRGDNASLCGQDGLWKGAPMVCEEVNCGPPPVWPHSSMLWSRSSRVGSEVLYRCTSGYKNVGESNISTCSAAGRWEGAPVLCQEILCGNPPVVESSVQEWDGNSAPGSSMIYYCIEGFYNKGGNNVSVCTANGWWTTPAISCQEISCGDPPTLPHTGQSWNGRSTSGSEVVYHCKTGFYHDKGDNISRCTASGHWTLPSISCKEVNCGPPPDVAHAVRLWDHTSAVGSRVVYRCDSGYRRVGGGNTSICSGGGEWAEVSLLCQELDCQEPVFKPHAKVLLDGASHVGSVVYYQCEDGYHTRGLRDHSVCGGDGVWEESDLWCEEISCGPPLTLPHTNLLWDGTSAPGSVLLYECVDGFYQESGNGTSTCLTSGEWAKVSVTCKAKCGPVPFLANSEVLWHNRSVVIHRCVDGYHSWRGSNISVCGGSGTWRQATLQCIEIKPPINHLFVSNEQCLQWSAEKFEEDTEVYKVIYAGSRDYDAAFLDKGKRRLTSRDERVEVCLLLLPATNYSISITAVSTRFTVTITTNTSLTAPPAPVVYYREFDTPMPTLRLRRSPDTLDAISLYQVFVLRAEGVVQFNCSSAENPNPSGRSSPSIEYIAAQMRVRHVGTEMNLTVGDGGHHGGFYNAPLENGRSYYIILRAVSQWKRDFKSACVLWAKVKGTSYALWVSSVSAAAAVGALALVALGVYVWFSKRHDTVQ